MSEIEQIRLNKADLESIAPKKKTGMGNPVAAENTKDIKLFKPDDIKEETQTDETNLTSSILAEYNIDINKPLIITKEIRNKMKAKGEKGFFESLKDGAKNAIPFISGIMDIINSTQLLNIVRKQKKGEKLTKEETEKLYEYMLKQVEEEERGSTFMGKVGSMLSHLPAFAGEFLVTGGIYSFGKNLAAKTITKGLQSATRKTLGKYVVKGAVEAMAGSAMRTIALPHMVVNNYVQRRLTTRSFMDGQENLYISMNENKENEFKTGIKALTDSYIEVLSEQSGEGFEFFGKLWGNKLLRKAAKTKFEPLIHKTLKSKPVRLMTKEATKKALARTGYNGIFGEYFEERLGGVLRSLTGTADENKTVTENLKDAIIPGWEQSGVELITSMLWGGTMANGYMAYNSTPISKARLKTSEKLQQVPVLGHTKFVENMKTNAQISLLINEIEAAKKLEKARKEKEIKNTKPSFKEKRKILFSKMKQYKALRNNIQMTRINEYNILLLERIIQNEKLCNCENLMKNLGNILNPAITQEEAKAKISILDKITNNEKLCNCGNLMENLGYILRWTQTQEEANAKISILDKITNNEKFYNCENLMNDLGNILRQIETKEHIEILNKIFDNEKLYNCANLMNNLGNILYKAQTPEEANAKISILDKITNNEKLCNCENLMKNLGDILYRTQTQKHIEILNKIFDNEKLYTCETLMKNLGCFLYYISTQKHLEIVNKIFDNEKLYNCENLMENLGTILYYTRTHEQTEILNKILDNEDIMKHLSSKSDWYFIRYCETQENVEAMELMIDELLENPELLNIMADHVGSFIAASKTRESFEATKLTIDEITKIQKENPELFSKCDFLRIQQILTLINMPNIKNISDNLVYLHKISDIQDKMNESERILFGKKIEEKLVQIAKNLEKVITLSDSKKEDLVKFFKEFMLNRTENIGDTVLASKEFSDYLNSRTSAKQGLPLAFSRKEFINELNKLLSQLPEEIATQITEKIGIEFTSKIAKIEEPISIDKPNSTFSESNMEFCMKKFEEKLTGKEQTSETLKINGQEVEIIRYEGTQGGSNEGYFAKNKTTGEYYYVKFPTNIEAAKQEILASKLYRLAGILTPELSFVQTSDGQKSGIASKIVPNTKNISETTEQEEFKKGYAVDAWLANWDILKNNNAEYSPEFGTVIRMDVGGSLQYRAQNGLKLESDFNYQVLALRTLIENNQSSALVNMDAKTLSSSLERIISLNDNEIRNLVKECHCDGSIADTLIARKAYLSCIYSQLMLLASDTKITPELLKNLDGNIKYTNGTTFNGIISDKNLDNSNQIEKQIADLVRKFIYENEIQTGQKNIDTTLNQLIKAFPEYISIIGKGQHDTHDSTLDIHILKVLNYAENMSEYKTLSDMDKLVLKFAILFHDIAKSENQRDPNHPNVGAYYVRDILRKINLPIGTKERIIEFVKNHNWFEQINKGKKDADYIATLFRRPGDLILAKIIAEADVHSVNEKEHFAQNVGAEHLSEKINSVENSMRQLHQNGSFMFTTPYLQRAEFAKNTPRTKIVRNGKEYNLMVLNFTKNNTPNNGIAINNNTDLRQYGFLNQYDAKAPLTRKDLHLAVHCTSNPMDIYYLSDITADSDLCVSRITPDEIGTVFGDKFGVVVEATNQSNIGSSLDEDQGSSIHKNINDFSEEIFHGKRGADTFTQEKIIEYFKNKWIKLSKKDYSKIHEEIVKRKFASHIEDIILENGKVITKKNIINADEYLNKQLRAKYQDGHNETNVYAPKVIGIFVRVDSIEDLPTKYLEAAEKLDVPILLFQ